MTSEPAFGIYDALIDKALQDVLNTYPELRAVFGKLEPEEQPARYADFIAKVMEQVLREEHDPAKRLALCNAILDKLTSASDGSRQKSELTAARKSLLLEITPPHYGKQGIPRPHTPISESSLFTGSPKDPQLVHELQAEMLSADTVDILVSFIKWSGLRLLMPALEDLSVRVVPVRVITTSYMGASDAAAIEHLTVLPNNNVRVSYGTERTRLHAKGEIGGQYK